MLVVERIVTQASCLHLEQARCLRCELNVWQSRPFRKGGSRRRMTPLPFLSESQPEAVRAARSAIHPKVCARLGGAKPNAMPASGPHDSLHELGQGRSCDVGDATPSWRLRRTLFGETGPPKSNVRSYRSSCARGIQSVMLTSCEGSAHHPGSPNQPEQPNQPGRRPEGWCCQRSRDSHRKRPRRNQPWNRRNH